MKRLAAIPSLLLALALLAAPVHTLAQGDEIEWAEFVSVDEKLTVQYPAEWFARGTLDAPGYVTATSETLLAKLILHDSSAPMEPGDAAMQVFLFPMQWLTFVGVEFDRETTLEDLTADIADVFLAPPDNTATTPVPAYEVGEAEIVLVGEDEIEVGIAPVSLETQAQEGLLLVRTVAPGVVAFGAAFAYTGEFDEDMQARFVGSLASLAYDGTADDLMDQLTVGGISAR